MLDPKVQEFLRQMEELGLPPLETLSPAEAREAARALRAMGGAEEPVGAVEDREIPGPAGPIPVRIYRPDASASSPSPALVYFHGGGWVIGGIDTHDGTCRALTRRTGAVTVSVDYRLAPENPFPAAVEDAEAAVRWLAAAGTDVGVDPQRIAVGGDSAGGNLAAVVARRCHHGRGPGLVFQLLVYPVTDLAHESASYRENGEGYFLTRSMMQWFRDQYLPDPALRSHPDASPLLAESLEGLPPALVITAEYDPLRDEGEAYAARLRDAGVPAKVSRYAGMIHGFFSMGTLIPRADDAIREAAEALRAALRAPAS